MGYHIDTEQPLKNVRDYGEELGVLLVKETETGRDAIVVYNQGGYDFTIIDAEDLYHELVGYYG